VYKNTRLREHLGVQYGKWNNLSTLLVVVVEHGRTSSEGHVLPPPPRRALLPEFASLFIFLGLALGTVHSLAIVWLKFSKHWNFYGLVDTKADLSLGSRLDETEADETGWRLSNRSEARRAGRLLLLLLLVLYFDPLLPQSFF